MAVLDSGIQFPALDPSEEQEVMLQTCRRELVANKHLSNRKAFTWMFEGSTISFV